MCLGYHAETKGTVVVAQLAEWDSGDGVACRRCVDAERGVGEGRDDVEPLAVKGAVDDVAGRSAEASFQLGDVRSVMGVVYRFDKVVLFGVCWTKSVPESAIPRSGSKGIRAGRHFSLLSWLNSTTSSRLLTRHVSNSSRNLGTQIFLNSQTSEVSG